MYGWRANCQGKASNAQEGAMHIFQTVKDMNANARFGVIALVLAALGLCTTIWISGAVPMHLLSMGVLLFGQLAYGQEAGLEKPLTKLVLVALFFSAIGFVMLALDGNPKAGVLFVFASFLSILMWALAMLHRPGPARATGKVGVLAGGLSLAILIGGHVFVGLGAALGMGALRSMGSASGEDVLRMVQITCIGLAIWSLVQAWMLFKGIVTANS
jgi:hypothetical protein